MATITPFLWFNDNAEEAATFYVSVFDGASIEGIMRGPEGNALTVGMNINGQHVTLLNGGPHNPHTEAFSFVIHCNDQDEVDYYWNILTADGGEEIECGWLKDKFGLSWQVTPNRLLELMSDPDPERAGRAMQAMLQMRKIIIADLEAAAGAAPA